MPKVQTSTPYQTREAASCLDIIRASQAAPLTASEACVLATVALFADGARGSCWASVATIARRSHVSERTTQRALAALVDAGWLVALQEQGRTTVYRCRVPEPGDESPTQYSTTEDAQGTEAGSSNVVPFELERPSSAWPEPSYTTEYREGVSDALTAGGVTGDTVPPPPDTVSPDQTR